MIQAELPLEKQTAERRILERLRGEGWIAVHEFSLYACSDTAISARLRELARAGKVVGRFREGTRLKEWSIA